jgi:hypothetical protein
MDTWKNKRRHSLRKSNLLHTDSNITESTLFRATLHTAPVRGTFTSFLASFHPSTLLLPALCVVAGPVHYLTLHSLLDGPVQCCHHSHYPISEDWMPHLALSTWYTILLLYSPLSNPIPYRPGLNSSPAFLYLQQSV